MYLSSSLCFIFNCWICSSVISSFSRSNRLSSRLSFKSSSSCNPWSSCASFNCVIFSARISPMRFWFSYWRCFICWAMCLTSSSACSCAISISRSFASISSFASSAHRSFQIKAKQNKTKIQCQRFSFEIGSTPICICGRNKMTIVYKTAQQTQKKMIIKLVGMDLKTFWNANQFE